MIAVNGDLIEMHTPVCADDEIAAGVDFCDDARYTDGIEAVFFKIFTAVISPQHHQYDLFAFKRSASGHFFVCVDCEKYIGIRYDDCVVNGNNCHILFSF